MDPGRAELRKGSCRTLSKAEVQTAERSWGATAVATAADQPRPRERGRGTLGLKRAADILGALFVLIVLAPLWLSIILMIRIDSPGSALLRQTRIGRGGREFAMFKFRTMIRDADRRKLELLHMNEAEDGLFKISRDPRVTRFGRFLRSTYLDELPQVVNVLMGTMSLVGPRPLIPEEDAQINGEARQRLTLRPGMTGPWQVAGASRVPVRDMVKIDLEYVDSHTLWGDVQLLLATCRHVLRRRGI